MLESVQNMVLENPLELYTAIIATAGVVFWIIDRRSIMAALHASKDHEMTALRLKRQESETHVERSFATLQSKCHATLDGWRRHRSRNGPVLMSGFRILEEEKQILGIMGTGKSLLEKLKASTPEAHCSEVDKFEAYIASADRISIQIESLAVQLQQP